MSRISKPRLTPSIVITKRNKGPQLMFVDTLAVAEKKRKNMHQTSNHRSTISFHKKLM